MARREPREQLHRPPSGRARRAAESSRAIGGAVRAAVLLGRKTYEAVRQQGGGGGMPGVRTYVFSRALRQGDCPGVTVSDDPTETVSALKAAPGKDI